MGIGETTGRAVSLLSVRHVSVAATVRPLNINQTDLWTETLLYWNELDRI